MMKKFKNVKLSVLIAVLYFLVVFLPAVFLLNNAYVHIKSYAEKDLIEFAEQAIDQKGSLIDYQMMEMIKSVNLIRLDSELQKYISKRSTPYEEYKELQYIQELIYRVQVMNSNFKVKIYLEDFKRYSSDKNTFFSIHDLDEQIRFRLNHSSYLGSQSDRWILTDETTEYICPIIENYRPSKLLGYVSVSINNQQLMANLEEKYSVDEENKIIFSNHTGSLPQLDPDCFKAEKGAIEKEGVHYVYTSLPASGWSLVDVLDEDDFNLSIGSNSNYTIIFVTFLVLILFLFLMYLIFMWLLIYLEKKIKSMLLRISPHVSTDIEEGRRNLVDLFENLDGKINTMLDEIEELTQKMITTQTREKDLQMQVLQAQINPHFLYNALDSINWVAIKNNNLEISEMIGLLAQYFRGILNKGNAIVTLWDELEFCTVYLNLQQLINPNKFTFYIDNQEEYRNYAIPKMTLQPLVENSLIHGVLKSANQFGVIRIHVTSGEGVLTIRIENSCDSTVKQTAKGKVRLENGQHFGLANIQERLNIYFQGQYVFNTDFQQDHAVVEIKIHYHLKQ